MKRFKVRYYYLATGMEGVADEREDPQTYEAADAQDAVNRSINSGWWGISDGPFLRSCLRAYEIVKFKGAPVTFDHAKSPLNFNAIDFAALNTIGDAALAIAQSKGFNVHEEGAEIDRKLLLIVREITEAQEELRAGHTPTEVWYSHHDPDNDNKPEGFPIELADTLIRLVQLMRSQGIDIAAVVEQKMKYNVGREHLHGRQF